MRIKFLKEKINTLDNKENIDSGVNYIPGNTAI